MTEGTLTAQIKTLETQLAVLKAQVKQWNTPTPPKILGDLYGILAGKVSSSEEEIDAAQYRFEWEGEEQR